MRRLFLGRPVGRAVLVATAAMAVALFVAACGDGEKSGGGSKGEVVITCIACQPSPSDPFVQYYSEATSRFNQKYAGRYRVKVVHSQFVSPSPERGQYYQRLALANDLPDLLLVSRQEGLALERLGKLMDFKPWLDRDAQWRDGFYPRVFEAVTTAGKTWAFPLGRNVIGVYYNREILAQAGVASYPETWDEFEQACEKVKGIGKSCVAMDGDWTTLLMWVNLIGTQPGGADWIRDELGSGDYASNPAVIRATETLKNWHVKGYTNRDAFAGDFQNAANAYDKGGAAFVPNGPWMVPYNINARGAVAGLYRNTG
jgi:raffinose/stachyose/melibiose transport system substrate-binding protein